MLDGLDLLAHLLVEAGVGGLGVFVARGGAAGEMELGVGADAGCAEADQTGGWGGGGVRSEQKLEMNS